LNAQHKINGLIKKGVLRLKEVSDLAVDLYVDKKFLMSGLACNVSLSGMDITCDPSFLRKGRVVDLSYELNTDGIPSKRNVTVLIVDILMSGIKVSFCDFDSNTFCCVRDMVLRSKSIYEDSDRMNAPGFVEHIL
jgi:hypothetical protein